MVDSRSSRTGVALAALAAACFVSVTSENLPVALLPRLAAGFGVSESRIGLLVTGYAIVVAVTVVPLVALTARFDRRATGLVTVATITVSNLVLACAPTYAVAVGARVVSAIGHGVFWSIVAPMAARLLDPRQAGRATTVIFAGNSLAFLFGLPLSSWLGATIGWRQTVSVVAVAAALAALLIRVTIDPMPVETPPAPGGFAGRRAGIGRVLADPVLRGANAATLVVVTGHFVAFSYITVLIAHYLRLTGSATSGVLLAHGAAGLLGLVAIGRRVDSAPRATALTVTAGLTACMLVVLFLGPSSTLAAAIALVLWAVPAGGMGVVLQAAVLRHAGDHQDLASAVYIVAFQIGIAAGAWAGGVTLDHDAVPSLVGLAAACGLTATLIVRRAPAFVGVR
ncbi:MFS transporter [Nocardia sp. NPDC003482]